MDSFLRRFSELQNELKAPKGQRNSFGGYMYRSCEDILEAVKPLLLKYGMALKVSDDLLQVGDRYYICATATLMDVESIQVLTNSAYAREAETKKGMDESQITGTTSSYARKYALNGLFCIDDTKDADTDDYTKQTQRQDLSKKPTSKNPRPDDNRPGLRMPPKEDERITCEGCGKFIADYWDGERLVKAAEIAQRSQNKTGKVLCFGCGKAVNNEKSN